MRNIRKAARLLVSVYLLTIFFSLPVSAEFLEESYCYNSFGQSVPAPAGYQLDGAVYGDAVPDLSFGMADDMAVYNGELYILNLELGVIYVLDADMVYQRTISFTLEGRESPLNKPTGISIHTYDDQMEIYVADTENRRIIRADAEGNILQEYQRPDNELFPEEMDFRPSKVLQGRDGTVYAICQGLYKGAATFSRTGHFLGFYGSNNIGITLTMLIDHFWKSLMNRTQLGRIQRNVPIEYTNFAVDSKGFIYTCTRTTENSLNQIKRLNAKGVDLLPPGKRYGDVEDAWRKSEHLDTSFVDIALMGEKNVAALDAFRGRVFVYSSEGMLLTIIGDTGRTAGTFTRPSAVACIGEAIYVLDPYKNKIAKFVPTQYGHDLLQASDFYQDGLYEESLELWNRVIQQNGNFESAYVGIARALMGEEQYGQAMEYFKKGQDRLGFSQAYEQVRKEQVKAAVIPVILMLGVLFILGTLYGYFFKVPKDEPDLESAALPVKCRHTLLHPTDGFTALSQTGGHKVTILSLSLVAVWFVTAIIQRQFTGFIFNPNQIEKLDIRLIFASTIVVYTAFVISNRLVCALLSGNGSTRDIMCVSGVSLIPMLSCMLTSTALSHFLTANEGFFLNLLAVLGAAWSLILLIQGMSAVHEYEFSKSVVSLLLTVAGMLMMAFIALLAWGLYNQVFAFFKTVADEISYMSR